MQVLTVEEFERSPPRVRAGVLALVVDRHAASLEGAAATFAGMLRFGMATWANASIPISARQLTGHIDDFQAEFKPTGKSQAALRDLIGVAGGYVANLASFAPDQLPNVPTTANVQLDGGGALRRIWGAAQHLDGESLLVDLPGLQHYLAMGSSDDFGITWPDPSTFRAALLQAGLLTTEQLAQAPHPPDDIDDAMALVAGLFRSRNGWIGRCPGAFLDLPLWLTIDTRTYPTSQPAPVPRSEEASLAAYLLRNLDHILPSAERAWRRYADEYPDDLLDDLARPHIWIARESTDDDGLGHWALVLERESAPSFGFHLEFEGEELKEIWAGD